MMSKEAIAHYEAALKEAFPRGATGEVFHHWNEARYLIATEALDKMAENARELGLDYDVKSDHRLMDMPAQQEPVAGQPLPCPFCGHIGLDFADGETYRWGVASCGGCGASCGDVRREYPDKGEWHTEAIAEWNKRSPAAQRTWVGLTDEAIWSEYQRIWPFHPAEEPTLAKDIAKFANAIEAKLKEKNNG